MKKQKPLSAENVEKKTRNIKNNRRRGNDYERVIAQELRELGYNVVTSRSESKSMDDMKIDLIDKNNELPYIQIKKTINTPDYFKIVSECPLKDRPFILFWNKQVPTTKTFRSLGEVVILQKEFFYKLITTYNGKQ